MSVTKKRVVLATTVLLLLGGVAGAGALAVHNGWDARLVVTGFSRLTDSLTRVTTNSGEVQPVDVGLFCNRHGVPEKFCTLCHEELTDKLLMCVEHGLPEAVCTLCHPENEGKYGLKGICADHGLPEALCPQCNVALSAGEVESDWCAGHGIPESLCILCDPARAEDIAMCSEHAVPEAVCTICRPELSANFTVCDRHKLPVAFFPQDAGCQTVSGKQAVCPDCLKGKPCSDGQCPASNPQSAEKAVAAKATLPRVRFAKADIAEKAGLQVSPVESNSSSPTITANCEVGYDETRLAEIRPRVEGFLTEVSVDLGNRVQKGDLLAVVDSAELGEAKATYLAALPLVELWEKNLERYRTLNEKGIVAGAKLIEAEAELARAKAEVVKARQRLRNFGLQSYEIASLPEEHEDKRNLMRILAPQHGVIVRRDAVDGEAVQATSVLFAVADLSQMWVHADVYEKDLDRVRIGQPVTVRIPGLLPRTFTGQVSWIGSEVDPRTRTIRVRVDVKNEGGWLRANMFGEAEIRVGEPSASLLVPQEAVQWQGSSYVVFVQKGPDLFEPRRVLRGGEIGEKVQLVWADRLEPGDRVVTTGSFLLKTELNKGAIGAGCCAE